MMIFERPDAVVSRLPTEHQLNLSVEVGLDASS